MNEPFPAPDPSTRQSDPMDRDTSMRGQSINLGEAFGQSMLEIDPAQTLFDIHEARRNYGVNGRIVAEIVLPTDEEGQVPEGKKNRYC